MPTSSGGRFAIITPAAVPSLTSSGEFAFGLLDRHALVEKNAQVADQVNALRRRLDHFAADAGSARAISGDACGRARQAHQTSTDRGPLEGAAPLARSGRGR